MKKKSKILNKLITAMFAVLCVALLCVPAFASSDDLVEVFPETTFSVGEDGTAKLSDFVLFSVGSTYVVNWNGVKYTCVALDASSVIPGAVVMGNGESFGFPGSGEPFVFESVPGDGTAVLALDGSLSFTVSIYEITSYFFSTTFTPTSENDGVLEGVGSVPLVEGEKYLCTVNGEELVATAFLNDSIAEGRTFSYLGNIELILPNSGLPSDSSLPFLFVSVETDSGFKWTLVSEHITNEELTFTIGNVAKPFISSIMSDAGNVVSSLTSWIGSVARMVINEPVLLIGFTIGLATLAFGIFKGLKR